MSSFKELLKAAHISDSDAETVLALVLPGESSTAGLPRAKLNVALALVALSQQGEELTLDAVDDLRHRRLPVPKLATKEQKAQEAPSEIKPASPTKAPVQAAQAPVPQRQTAEEPSTASTTDDPWSNGSSSRSHHYDESPSVPEATTATPSYTSPAVQGSLDFDAITVTTLEGKEGMPLWKHLNYAIKSAKRKSNVVRRYSDFAWLLECLLKKYPFRQVPLLPPKRLAVNGIYIRIDAGFLEKRRRGLSRFANALERHPVFKIDQLVTTFLTVPTELAVWRKQASISVQEEFEDRYLAPDLEASLPQGIDDWMYKTRVALAPAIESFTSLVVTQERLIKRQEVAGTDHLRLSLTLNTFCEQQGATYDVLGKEHGPGIVRGLQALSRHHTTAQQTMEQECRALEDAVLEDLKRHRDTLTAMHELFVRHAKYAGDNVSALEKRIAAAKTKLHALDNKVDAKENDKAKLRESIQSDQNTIVKLMSRRVFVRECVWHELQVFEAQQVHISRLVNDLAGLRADFAKRLLDLAVKLQGDVEGMP
ncbi:hypothetical protein BCR37DRAFT_383602 [Protomyces lactucae-debilis]|uniref:Sorting nexin MVP1 n=1 Tax=Protomyces lactucae-debilis TaxID=2754530 RepID=A0A1Y2EXT3_PROLT|nr:uncharacterized protein BCR37DRAFT_383602 [Protomyces lactucae-debilis]ORY76044.1 hypothetical protein BCR37DRAFT_383602 [Protomyces lactucae-debilis]